MEHETEFKSLLTKDQFDRIAALFPFGKPEEQINHYYMDEGKALADKKITVRVREKQDRYKLQVKVFRSDNDGVVSSDEYEKEVSEVPQSILPADLPADIGVPERLEYIGALTTLRRTCVIGSAEICLDENRYLGTTDYEIEIEYTEKAPDEIMQKLFEAGVKTGNASGKRARFDEEKQKQAQ